MKSKQKALRNTPAMTSSGRDVVSSKSSFEPSNPGKIPFSSGHSPLASSGDARKGKGDGEIFSGCRSVTNDIEGVLRKIEYWHQGSIAALNIMYCDENRVWDGVRWDGQHPSIFALGETDEQKARERLRRMVA